MGNWGRHPNNPNRNSRQKAVEWYEFTLPPLESNVPEMRMSPPRKRTPPLEWWKISAKPTTITDWSAEPDPPPVLSKETALVPKEEWKPHPYWKVLVSTYGRVQLPRGTKSFGSPNQRGYLRVSLKDPQTKKYRKAAVHRLVAEAHASPRTYRRMLSHGFVVNHKDNNPGNNWLTNLEFVTGQANSQHYWDNIYPEKKREDIMLEMLKGKCIRPFYIADEHGRIRQANRRLNINNDSDREWLKEMGYWDSLQEIVGAIKK